MKAHPVVITDAARSQEDQLRTRTIRYVVMMSIRVLCLVAAVVLASLGPPLLWLWLTLCGLGMVLIPWVAVVLANDKLPKERHRWRHPAKAAPKPAANPASHPAPITEKSTRVDL